MVAVLDHHPYFTDLAPEDFFLFPRLKAARLLRRIRRFRPELHRIVKWMLFHDNASAHSEIIVRQFLAHKMVAVLDHPPYLTDLAPADFFLFPRLKAARLLRRIRRFRPELHRIGKWMLLHDNSSAHSEIIVRQFLAHKMVAVLDQPPYSPDLTPTDFFLFPSLKAAQLLWRIRRFLPELHRI